jgi:putative ATP-dependent endonuclease of OLD family
LQIIKVGIHNFCSIHDGSFELQDYNLLIGANNSGKSNTINAIRAFYEDLKYESSKHKPLVGETDEHCWVELTFQLTSDEYAALDSAYQVEENRLRVRRILSAPQGAQRPGLYAYESAGLASKPYRGKLGKVIYIPAASKVEDHTKTSGPSPLRDLINDVFSTIAQTSEAYQRLVEAFQAFSQNVRSEQANGNRSIQGLEAALTESLTPWNVQFVLNIVSMTPDDIVKTLVSPRLKDDQVGEEQRIEQFGQGLQREIIFQLIRFKSQYLEQDGDNSTELTMLLFEEPEAFLHPTQQLELAERLRTLSQDDGSQVLLSTHSPHFVSYESDNLTSLIRLSRQDGRTVFGQISTERLSTILSDNQSINQLFTKHNKNVPTDDASVDMEAVKYFMWLDPNRCGMFFASRVLLVEGSTESVFVNFLIRQRRLTAMPGVFVLDCGGKYNFHRYMQLLHEFKVPHSVLFDDDGQKPFHKDLEAFINGHKNPFTCRIETVPDCIEKFMGIDIPPTHRRPQHLLYKYKTGAIAEDKIAAFVAKVEPLLS